MTMAIPTVENIRCYVDEQNTAYLNAEDVVRSLDFSTDVRNGFIPENMFYRLAMKESNESAQKFQEQVADVILPSIRKNGMHINPNAPIEPRFLCKMADELEAHDKKLPNCNSKPTTATKSCKAPKR